VLFSILASAQGGESLSQKQHGSTRKKFVGEILIQYKPATSEEEKRKLRESIGAVLKESIRTPPFDAASDQNSNTELVAIRRELTADKTKARSLARVLELIKKNPSVAYAEVNSTVTGQKP
jgi:uncharacterized membrane protein YhiD involved in acid resistance